MIFSFVVIVIFALVLLFSVLFNTLYTFIDIGSPWTSQYTNITPRVLMAVGGFAGGVLFGKVLYLVTGGKINPLIGSAGVSAVPMAARVSNKEGQKANPSNFLLMHAMGPNVAGVIGSAIAAGFLLSVFGG